MADILVRTLASVVGTEAQGVVRASADDTAVALREVQACLPSVMRVFREYASVSNYRLLLAKTVLILLSVP